MKIAPICLLTACMRHKFKLFGDSSQVRAIENGIMCCYWSASLSNRFLALKAHSSLLKCCAKKRPNYMYWIQGKHCGSWVWVFLRLSVSLKLIFIVPFNFYSISIRGVTIHRCIGESYRNCQRYANRIVSGWIDSHDISSGGRNQAIKCP